MKTAYLLITMLTQDPIVYNDKSICLEAQQALGQMDQKAVCIPAGNYSAPKDNFATMLDFIVKLENLPPKEVDIKEE
tara:strand:+ start:1242 stop:1472 length:231 start_codon:yes stop_codon:yes gene_type:complete